MDKIYKKRQWPRLRDKALRRDGYLCRECLRYGKRVQANTAHHVFPVSMYPQWAWCLWNLISLCGSCHNAMHDRGSDSLTDKGLAWCRRISPPPSGGRSAL